MLYYLCWYCFVESRMLEEGMKKPPWRPLHLMGVSTCLIGTHMFTHFLHNLQKYTGKEICEMLTSENEEIDRTKTMATRMYSCTTVRTLRSRLFDNYAESPLTFLLYLQLRTGSRITWGWCWSLFHVSTFSYDSVRRVSPTLCRLSPNTVLYSKVRT